MVKLTNSVIICTRNRINDLVNALGSIQRQTVSPGELIIVDSSTDPVDTTQEFKHIFNEHNFPCTRLVYKHTEPGLTYQRNRGIELSTGEVLYFFDDDVLLEPSYLAEMQKIFDKQPDVGGGMGTITPMEPFCHNWNITLRKFFLLQRDYSSGKFTFSGMPTHAYGTEHFRMVEVLGGCCMAFRRKALEKHKFDENLRFYGYMEDCDISWRVSREYPLFYNPAARLQHLNSPLNRDKVIENRAMLVRNYTYLFFKNVFPHRRLALLGYCWSIIGLFIEALLLRQTAYIHGYCKGLITRV